MTAFDTAASADTAAGADTAAFRAALRGELLLPGDPGWDAARRGWQLLVDQRPAAIVVARDVDDIVAAVAWARAQGLRVAPQSTGHAAGTIGPLEDAVLVRTAALDGVAVRVDDRTGTATARVGAGATWRAVAAAAAEHGLAAVAGMAPEVGVVGFVLGGGLGWLARSHGLGAASVLSLEVVDARGRVLRVDDRHHAELFWAARGGSAPVIVTAVELALHRVDALHAGALMWPIERAADVAHAWREWIGTVPTGVTSLARVLRYPPIPEIPEPLRGRAFIAVEAALQLDAGAAADLLQPLRALDPEIDTVRAMGPAELGTIHGDPEQPVPAYGASVVLAEISPPAVDALLDAAAQPSAGALLSIELRHLGGAVGGSGPSGALAMPGVPGASGAGTSIEGEGLVFAVGIAPVPEAVEAVRAAASALVARLAPFAAPLAAKNFVERPAPPEALHAPDIAARLRRVAAEWDPERVIRTGHPLE